MKHKILDGLLPLAEPLDAVRPMEGNPRRGSVKKVAASLERFGQHRPIVVQRTTGEVLIGNHTLAAARSLGWTHIAVLWTDDDRQTAVARALADNRSHDGGSYDSAELAAQIEEITAADDDLLAATGFSEREAEALLAAANAASTPAPEPTVPVKRVERTPAAQGGAPDAPPRDPQPQPQVETPVVPGDATLYVGDCRDVLATMPTATFHSVVTDPLGGISKDRATGDEGYARWVPGVDFWTEVRRVTKPGGFIAVMGGPATFHRLAVACEDAGLVLHDTLAWLFTGGMTHGLDIGQRVDKRHGGEGKPWFRTINALPDDEREALRAQRGNPWDGWSTQLKPAWKPILLFRNPNKGSSIDAVVKEGVGALNIDDCRIEGGERAATSTWIDEEADRDTHGYTLKRGSVKVGTNTLGRWPADVVLDEDVAVTFGEQARYFVCSASSKRERNAGLPPGKTNDHPVVRPVDLAEWLVRLITPEGGTVLDPFAGSGTTGVAAVAGGFGFCGIDRNETWITDIAQYRIDHARREGRSK